MKQPDYEAFFRDYLKVFDRSIAGPVDTDAIRASYADHFITASAGGVVAGVDNDEAYGNQLKQGADFYKAIGLQKMTLRKVQATEIDAEHDMVRPFFSADYRKTDGTPVTIDFDVVYLMQRRPGGPKIFAFVAGDEMALYRKHGLVDEAGKPT